jgi:hypothetical protein
VLFAAIRAASATVDRVTMRYGNLILFVVLALALVGVLSACGGKGGGY